MPAGGLAVERCLKEGVSRRGHRVGCPLTNPLHLQSKSCGVKESSRALRPNGPAVHPARATGPGMSGIEREEA